MTDRLGIVIVFQSFASGAEMIPGTQRRKGQGDGGGQ
jgi:hypothetical protein